MIEYAASYQFALRHWRYYICHAVKPPHCKRIEFLCGCTYDDVGSKNGSISVLKLMGKIVRITRAKSVLLADNGSIIAMENWHVIVIIINYRFWTHNTLVNEYNSLNQIKTHKTARRKVFNFWIRAPSFFFFIIFNYFLSAQIYVHRRTKSAENNNISLTN